MMNSSIGHIQLNVKQPSLRFYKNLFTFLGWTIIHEDPKEIIGVVGKNGEQIWCYARQTKDVTNDYDGPGMNHLGISVASQQDVDAAASFLKEQGIEHLFETPRHRPDYAASEDHTYYQ